MKCRCILGLMAIILAAVAVVQPAMADDSTGTPGLQIQLTPYLWLPTIDSTLRIPVPGGGTVTTTTSTGAGEYLPHLSFAAMLAAEARYDRFSVLTDIIYMNLSASETRIRSYDFGLTSIPVERVVSTTASARIQSTIWTLAGGYTVAEGSWGNVDIIAGFRMLAMNQSSNLSLSADITRPDGSIALGRSTHLSDGNTIWNGVGGVRGRVYVGDADWFGGGRIFVPFYFDIGAGGSNLTWQIFSGVGYQTGRLGVSLGYRYMSFKQGSSAVVEKLNLGGPIMAVNITF